MVQSMGVNAVFGLLIFSITVIKAQEYVISDEPDFNVWDSEDSNQNVEAANIFSVLCENYHLTINNEDIDCSRIQFTPKESLLDDNNHVIRKREADSAELEGSGNAENEQLEVPAETQSPVDQEPAQNPVPNSVDLAPLASNSSNDAQEETQESDKDAQTADLANGVVSANKEPEDGQNKEEKPAEEPPKETDKNDSTTQPPKLEAPEQAGSENADAIADVFETAAIKTEEQPKEQESKNEDVHPEEHDVPRSETTMRPPSESTKAPAITVNAIGKDGVKTQKVLPSDLAEVETDKEVKESEVVDDEQSANAVIIKEPKVAAPDHVEGSDTDKQLARLATNAKASVDKSSDSEPSTGESSQTVSKAGAGKDTTILVVLFAVVVVIGGAAFAYNFIKKRKERSSENNDGVNGIRKSLQNLVSGNEKHASDVEQGTEMKPLMKTESPVLVKEFSDVKKDVEA